METSNKSARVTLNDVAALAGVSVATASRALKGGAGVSAETLSSVVEAAVKSGYPLERYTSRRAKRYVVGMIVANIRSPFYATLVQAVEEAASRQGFSLLLCSSNYDSQREKRFLELLAERDVAGIIVTPVETKEPFLQNALQRLEPIVQVDRYIEGLDSDFVTADHYQGAFDAVKHLLDVGYRDIGILTGPHSHLTGRERLRGYEHALREAGVEPRAGNVHVADFSQASAFVSVSGLIKERSLPEALFVSNIDMTIGAIRALREHQVRIPNEVALVGFDEFDLASAMSPSITTVEQPVYMMGSTAMGLLARRIEQGIYRDKPVQLKFRTWLNIRQSSLRPEPANVLASED